MDYMAFRIHKNLHVIVAGVKNPSKKDWDAYIEAVRAEEKNGIDVTKMRTIVFTDGGGPDAAQRKIIADILNGRATPIAIVTGPAWRRRRAERRSRRCFVSSMQQPQPATSPPRRRSQS